MRTWSAKPQFRSCVVIILLSLLQVYRTFICQGVQVLCKCVIQLACLKILWNKLKVKERLGNAKLFNIEMPENVLNKYWPRHIVTQKSAIHLRSLSPPSSIVSDWLQFINCHELMLLNSIRICLLCHKLKSICCYGNWDNVEWTLSRKFPNVNFFTIFRLTKLFYVLNVIS